MKKTKQECCVWWRLPLLFFVCLLGGSSPALASTNNFGSSNYTKIIGSPSPADPYYRVRIMFYDADGSDSFFCHNKTESDHPGPAVYVDDNWICSPDAELAWPDSDKDDGGTGAGKDCYAACANNNGWWGSGYSREINGITYTVMFWDPQCTGTDNTGGQRYVDMFVFISKLQVGSTHTIRVKGRWKVHGDSSWWREVKWSANASDAKFRVNSVLALDGYGTPTATMSGYGKMKVSGTLNANYGPTTVGTYSGANGQGWTDNLTSYCGPYDKGISNYSNQELDFSERDDYWNSKTKYLEYIVTDVKTFGAKQMPEVKLYQWFTTSVPGFMRAKDMNQNNVKPDVWSKKITITWEADDSGNRSKAGTWTIYRNNKEIARSLSADKRSYDDTSTDLEYNTNYTYDVYFVPNNTPSDFDPTKKITELKKSVTAILTPSFTFRNLNASNSYEDKIVLTWSHTTINNASEANPYYMIVERSTDKSNWVEKQSKKITSSSTEDQEYTEYAQESGLELFKTYYYRVKINAQGQTFYSSIVTGSLDGMTTVTAFTATRGTYTNVVKLKWDVKQVGTSLSYFYVYRRMLGSSDENDWVEIYSTTGTQASYSYDDVTAQPGSFNEYKVVTWMMDGTQRKGGDEFTTDGFCISSGVISGRVTYGTGAAVDGVKVMIKQQGDDGNVASNMHSFRFDAQGNAVRYETTTDEIQSLFKGDFSVQLYIKPVSPEMASNNQDYITFDVENIFTIRLWYNSADTTFTVGGWIDGNEKSNIKIKGDEWSQLTFVHTHSPARTDVYVATPDTIMKANILNRQVNWNKNALATNRIAIGNSGSLGVINNFRGFVDEFRLFTKALTEKEFLRNYNHTLAGNEPGLAIYYPMDEGITSQTKVYDYSKTNNASNGRHALTVKGYNTTTVPNDEQLSIMAYTDSIGNYVIRGVPFAGEGTNYSIIPQKGTHDFSPLAQSRYVSQSSLIHSGVDFEDISSFPVSGQVVYSGTDYPVEGCSFYVDGTICAKDGEVITTNSEGQFEISVPIGDHFIQVKKSGHVFVNNGRFPADPNGLEKYTFTGKVTNLEFRDTTLVNFTGRIVGGSIEGNKNVGFALSTNTIGVTELILTPQDDTRRLNVRKTVTNGVIAYPANTEEVPIPSATTQINSTSWRGANNADCGKLFIHTDPETGEFSALVPPLQYHIAPMMLVNGSPSQKPVGDATTVDLTNPNIELYDTLYNDDGTVRQLYKYNTMLKHTYHADTKFIVTQEDAPAGAFGIKSYTLKDAKGDLEIKDIYTVSGDQVSYKKFTEKGEGVPLFIKEDSYTFLLEGYEDYKNVDNGAEYHVPLKGNVVTINNALSAEQKVYVENGTVDGQDVVAGQVVELQPNQLTLDDEGKAKYKWMAGLPNIAEPYTRTLSISYDIDGRTYQWNDGKALKGIILGDLPTGNNFLTAGPDKLLMILRDPPGTNSFAEWTSGSSTTTSTLRANTFTENFTTKFQHKFGLCTQTIIGTPGAGDIIVADSKDDLTVGAKMESSGENAYTRTTTTTITQTISTSAAPEYVGDQGDVFVGTSTNVIFGKARNIGFKRIDDSDEAALGLDDIVTTGLEYKTMFNYTRNYIEHVLFPEFYQLRKTLLTRDGNAFSQSEIDSYTNNTDRVVYLTSLKPDHPDFGKPGTYTSFAPAVKKPGEHYPDSVIWVNNQIDNWKNYLGQNEAAKVLAYKERDHYIIGDNISFDSGTTVTNTMETTHSNTHTWDWTVSAGLIAEDSFGFEINKFGIECTIEDETMGGTHEVDENGEETTTSFSYTLAEDGDDDALSVDVLRYDAYSPIFHTRGGQTSCPYEGEVVTEYYERGTTIMEATMQIEVPDISAENPVVVNVPSGGAANYGLALANHSEIDEDVYYRLLVADETNPDGAILMIDGKVITDNRVIKIPAGQTIYKSLQLKQSKTDVLDYKNIALVLASQCQYDPTSTWDVITDTLFITAQFVPSSSPVELALSNTVLNAETGTNLRLMFSGFDRNYKNLKAFRLQYKKPGTIDWTLLKEYVLDENGKTANQLLLPTDATVTYVQDMASFPDGDYLFRVVSVATYGNDEVYKYSDEIALVKDVVKPRPLGQPEPTDGVLDIGDELSLTFNEPIIKGELTKMKNFTISGVLNGSEVAHETALSVGSGSVAASTEASINLANKDFSIDTWVNITNCGTLLTHGQGSNKLIVGTNNAGKLVVKIGDNTYTSTNSVPTGEWAFLTMNMTASDTEETALLSATVATSEETISLFNGKGVAKYSGNGPLSIGTSSTEATAATAAIHELLLWDEAHDVTTALLNRSKTKSPSTRHLIGYWKMDEGEGTSIRDYSRSRNMTMAAETWYLNNENKAVSLDGSHYVSINAAELPITTADDYTVEFWMRGDQQTGEAQLMQMGEVALWLNTQGQLQLTGKEAYKPADQQTANISTQSANLLDNTWHHIALNVLRQGAAAIYVDGKRCLTTNADNVGSIVTNNMIVGAKRTTFSAETGEYTFDRAFKGEVDEIRVWNATMNGDLLAKNRKVRFTGNEAGLMAYYPFEDKVTDLVTNQTSTVGVANDLTGSGHAAELLTLNSQSATLNYVDEAPALRTKPAERNVNFDFTASNEKIVINIDEDAADIEGCTINLTINSVRDENGNYSDPVIWSAFVNRNELVWGEDALSMTQHVETSSSIDATIVNKGGKQQMWTLDGMPAWLTASAEYGTTNPKSESVVTFTVSPSTPIGKYEETIYLKGNDGIETPLTINVKVTGDEPLWSVNVGDYEESMNLIGELDILGVPSEDEDDIVAAFINDECRGVAHPKYIKKYDRYFVTIDIYNNSSDNNNEDAPEVEFKVYDASTGTIYPVVTTSEPVEWEANSFLGRYKTPINISATDMIEQSIDLENGWNWMSLSVAPETFTVPVVFEKANGKVLTVKSQSNGTITYSNGQWVAKPSKLYMNNQEMYVVKTSEPLTLTVTGRRVKPADVPITVKKGWNWIGYNGMKTVSLTEALTGMNPQDGDVIKAQRGVAYFDEFEWIGSLNTLVPGQGYKIQSDVSNDRTFSYPSTTTVAGARRAMPESEVSNISQPLAFTPVDYSNYPANMVLFAQVVLGGSPVEGIELGVFAGEECREAAVTDERGMVYITIPGDESCELTFRVSDGTGIHEVSSYTINYETDAVIGTPKAPFIISIDNVTGIADNIRETINNSGEVYDLQGRKIVNRESVNRKLRKGVYIVNGQKKVK